MIGIVEAGGGWVQSDIDAYFELIDQPVPSIVNVPLDIDNAPNSPADVEVALDIEVAAASYYCATGRPATIRVYWTQDLATGIEQAASDGCDTISVSWGSAELGWGADAANNVEQAAIYATNLGAVVLAASGDNDADDGAGGPSVDLPAAAPHVIACGGTTKTKTSETVWNNNPGVADGRGTGGGYSSLFPLPMWQTGAPNPPSGLGRMVPDIAANADLETGYEIVLHGKLQAAGGTSAVAPLYAGLFAAFGRKLGFIAPELWSHAPCFTDIMTGDNGAYRAGTGPDPCTGLGVPIGTALAALFDQSQPAASRRMRNLIAQNQMLCAQLVAAK